MNRTRALIVSFEVLMGHKLRTFLSSSGIAIGVAAVVLMVGAGQAAQLETQRKVQSMGTNLLVVQAGKFKTVAGRTFQSQRFTTLKPSDARVLQRQVPEVALAGGLIERRANARYRALSTRTHVAGCEPSTFEIRNIRAARGRLFTPLEERSMARVAVLGPTVASALFEGEDPVGKSVEINRAPFQIVGVTEPRGQDLQGEDQDDFIYVPLRSAMSRIYSVTYIQSPEAMEGAKEAIAYALRKTHRIREGKEDDFTIQDQRQLMAAEKETGKAFAALVASVAGISLFTGGIGILAVMLISIRERTREIGLRRALGAQRSDIRFQFVMESGLVALIGGFVGVLAGFGGTLLTCRIAGWPTVWPYAATLWASGLSVLMGILFGLYPAAKAARLEPATALHAAA
jgi:putative ABC transport system permease protein